MGQAALQKAVTSLVVRRAHGKRFRVGVAEMNGWRGSMEDAQVIHIRDDWGFFGVFDGHGGSQCSTYVAKRLIEELEAGWAPQDDAAVTALALRLDREFLATGQNGGSTGTFVCVTPPSEPEGRYFLRVGNVGDSRVLLGRADGSLVEGSGTDGGLTTDHKPDSPPERERIVRVGGRVEDVMGVARVNGDLAVSRAFGDGQYKQTGDPETSDHPVSAVPEVLNLDCPAGDILMLVCDGISEGDFPNRAVASLVAERLRACPDPAEAAAAVCRKALQAGSKDNLTCMVVLLGEDLRSKEDASLLKNQSELELLPGPFDAPNHAGFRSAYEAMASHAGLSLAQAVEMRHGAAQDALAAAGAGRAGDPAAPWDGREALEQELKLFGEGPPPELARGSDERVEWFRAWLEAPPSSGGEVDGEAPGGGSILELLQEATRRNPDLREKAESMGLLPRATPIVRVALLDVLRPAVEAHPSLQWHDELEAACDRQGFLESRDIQNGTSQVRFLPLQGVQGFTAQFPTIAVKDQEDGRLVRTATLEVLRRAVEAHPALRWEEKLAEAGDKQGTVVQDDPADGTSKVKFGPPAHFQAWLPTNTLADVPMGEEGAC
mmetsp:Transcript_79754/g.247348  ORF Transcript_79754/g.247348 Transcript_79754/m.247348 type:complete len:605 (+) Transcript_79754:85-1899(+)